MADFYVNLTPGEAMKKIHEKVVNGSVSGTEIDSYDLKCSDGEILTRIYEKYYYRSGDRLTLTVVADNLGGRTRIHTVGGGGGQTLLFRFDWGASDDFGCVPYEVLYRYIIEE